MGRKKLLIEEKTRVLTMLENGVPVIRLATFKRAKSVKS